MMTEKFDLVVESLDSESAVVMMIQCSNLRRIEFFDQRSQIE